MSDKYLLKSGDSKTPNEMVAHIAELEAEVADLWQFFREVKAHESASYWMEYPIKEIEEKYKPPEDDPVPDAGSWEEFSKFFV